MLFRGEDLFYEKNLWSVYRVCVTKLKRSRFNTVASIIFFLPLMIYVIFGADDKDQAATIIRSLADSGLGYGTTVLGFLIAGFTIFATLTKERLLRQMYETIHESSGLNYVKVNFYAFIEVFIVFLAFIILCLVIKIFAGANGPVSEFIHWFNQRGFYKYIIDIELLKKTSFLFFASFSFYVLLALKSFVYNIHHAVMTLIVWSLVGESETDIDN